MLNKTTIAFLLGLLLGHLAHCDLDAQIQRLFPPNDPIERAVQKASHKYGVEADLIRSVIAAESNFDPHKTSWVGAQGLMQLMPQTAKELGVEDPFDIEQNVDGGTRYLKAQIEKFDGQLEWVIAAYNTGPNAVERYDGIPPFQETRNYVREVKAHLMHYRRASANGYPVGGPLSLRPGG